jgi:hypothetical protein
MKLGKYIMPHKVISTVYIINPLISNTNTIASQLVEVMHLLLLECLDRSSWDVICLSCHMRSSQCPTEESLSLVILTLQPLKLSRQYSKYYLNSWTDRHETWYIYDMPSAIVSTAYIINPFHEQYQHCSLSDFRGNNHNTGMLKAIYMKLGT